MYVAHSEEKQRKNMRIFLALLLALLLADTITGSPTRSRRKSKGRRKRTGSSSKRLYDSLSDKLKELEESEKTRDDRIEKKMDVAIEDLKSSVRNMHENLEAFITNDAKISSNMEAQIQGMSDKVEGLSASVMGAIESINGAMPNDDSMTHQSDHEDIHQDEHEDPEHIDPIERETFDMGRQMRAARQEEMTETSTGDGSGDGDQAAAGEDAVEAEYQQGNAGSGEDHSYDNGEYENGYGDYSH